MEPHARTRPGLRPITWGGPGAREERQGRRCQCHQPRLGVPGGGEAPVLLLLLLLPPPLLLPLPPLLLLPPPPPLPHTERRR